jgi:CcmD family protein
MAFLFGAYFVLWGITFAYLFYLGSRQKAIQQELERLIRKEQASAPAQEHS